MKIRRILYIALLFILQIIANDYINLGPYIYVCFVPMMILIAPAGRVSVGSLLTAFGLGLMTDLLSDGVLGLNAAAGVLMAGLLGFMFDITVNRDNYLDNDCPTLYDVGARKYLRFLLLTFTVYFAAYVFLDGVGTRPFWFSCVKILATIALNVLLALLVNVAFFRRRG